jgi:NAD-dependent SIR2 family protein deacetylase
MINTDTGITEKIAAMKTALDKAEAVLIGAGSGLSNAAGLRYNDTGFFNATFPGYQDRHGLRTINEADFYQFPTAGEQYAYWIRLISAIRYNHPPGTPYLDLYRIIKDKNHFVLTTNTDGQFQKAGFDPENICTPQGDLAFFQCSKSCNDTIYPNEKIIQKMLASLAPNDFAISPGYIPHCPDCGSPLIPNVRKDAAFVEKPWIGQYQKLHNFIHAHSGKNILLLELGVGINTPGIIRYPLEHLTLQRNNTYLIRIKLKTDNLSLLAQSEKAAIIQADIGEVLARLAEEY